MPKYMVTGQATVSCWTEVEAGSAEEAIEIAERRELAGMTHSALSGEVDETFHFENDGAPTDLRAEEA